MFSSFIVFLIIYLSMTIFNNMNPFIMSLVVVMFTFFISVFINSFCHIWISAMITLIFLGGMMILFTYASSLTSFEKPSIPPKNMIFTSVIIAILTPEIFWMENTINLNKIFISKGLSILILITLYLLATLIAIVKMVSMLKGPLKI